MRSLAWLGERQSWLRRAVESLPDLQTFLSRADD
jgi:hypothetical protein